jgi:wyosine [tRNA(Phe)-imidazoG37] synthetase (radical SAM superfamily)
MSIKRKEFYPPNEIFKEVSAKVKDLRRRGEKIDYISFVPDGEPTLDINLGKEIKLIKQLGSKIAVITNSSLLNDENVRTDLLQADWVSIKIDTVDEKIWHQLNRPFGKLDLQKILNGIKNFRHSFKGTFVTETMIVNGLNDNEKSLIKVSDFLKVINPDKSYILVPTRPPAEEFVKPPSEENLNIAYQIFNSRISNVELLTGKEGIDFSYSSDVEKELLSILAVHPMQLEAVERYLNKAKADWTLIDTLIHKNMLKEVKYSGQKFLVRNLKNDA